MAKTVEEICNILVKKHVCNLLSDSNADTGKSATLASCVCSNTYKNNPYRAFFNDENLYNKLERTIIYELASAIDDNNVQKIKYLKSKYGNLNEFKKAKEFLNEKCKQIWNVYEPIKNLPKEAMKSLGITNQPDLDFIFENSLKYYEKDDSDTTAYIISSTLENQNLSYNMEDIHKYLKNMYIKQDCQYNFKTVKYLICEQNYDKQKLLDLGIQKNIITLALKHLPLKYKLKFLFKVSIKHIIGISR